MNLDVGGGIDLSGEQQRGIGVLDEFGIQNDDTYFGTLSRLGVPRLENDGFEYGDDLYSTNDVSWDPSRMILTVDSKQIKSAITKASNVLKAGTEDTEKIADTLSKLSPKHLKPVSSLLIIHA